MRSSSIKSLVAVLSITFTLAAVAPRAEARISRPQRDAQIARPGAIDRFQSAVGLLVKHLFGIAPNEDALPTDPVPLNTTNTPFIPKKQR